MMKRGYYLSVLLVISFLFCHQSYADESIKTYDFKIYSQTETMMGPLGALFTYFQVLPFSKATSETYVDIIYSNSEVIKSDISFLTLFLNGSPVSSTYINSRNPDTLVWRVNLPPDLIKEGYNEITLTSLQRTTDDPCKDLYNNANWVRILPSSNLHLELNMQNPSALFRFPYPYLNVLSNVPVTSRIMLKKPFSVDNIQALLKLVSDYGSKVPFVNLDILIGAIGDEFSGNKLYIGTLNELSGLVSKPLNQDEGYLLQSAGLTDDEYNIFITGTDIAGVNKALNALLNPNLLPQNEYIESVITRSFENIEKKYELPKQGLFLLNEIGFPHIKLEGIFTQRKSFIVKRPVRHGAGIESYLKVYFSHSDNLDRKQSLLSIFINGLPAGSISLGPENAKGGELVVKIPESELNKPGWSIEFIVYHYVGSVEEVNCVYDYNTVTWTFIEGTSEIYLAPGGEDIKPVLTDFPNLIGVDEESLDKIYFWLPESPDVELVKVAALLAAKSGQVLKRNVNFNVALSNSLDENLKNNASIVFAIGYPDNIEMWETFNDRILIKPEGGKKYRIDNEIETPNYDLSQNSIIQTFESPWNTNGVIYTVTLSSPSAIKQFTSALELTSRVSKFNGRVCLILPDANVVPLGVVEEKQVVESLKSPLQRLPLRYIIGGFVVIAVIIFLVYRYLKGRKK